MNFLPVLVQLYISMDISNGYLRHNYVVYTCSEKYPPFLCRLRVKISRVFGKCDKVNDWALSERGRRRGVVITQLVT